MHLVKIELHMTKLLTSLVGLLISKVPKQLASNEKVNSRRFSYGRTTYNILVSHRNPEGSTNSLSTARVHLLALSLHPTPEAAT